MSVDGDSVSAASFIMPERTHSAPPVRKEQSYMAPEEMYKVVKGQVEEWGVEGYLVTKKPATYHRQDFKFSKGERKTFLDNLKKRASDPDPTKYQPDLTKGKKPPEHRPIFKAPRNTYIDTILKQGPKTPGPGAHFKTEKTSAMQADRKKIKGMSFGKEEGINYLTTYQYYAGETPGAGHYFQAPKNPPKKAVKPNFFFVTPKVAKKPEKEKIGPGSYYTTDYVTNPKKDKLPKDPIRSQSARPIMNKAKRITTAEQIPKVTKDVPPVGHYKDVTKTTETFRSAAKDIHFYISKEKNLHRFPDPDIALKKFVPGPGTYKEEDDETKLRPPR